MNREVGDISILSSPSIELADGPVKGCLSGSLHGLSLARALKNRSVQGQVSCVSVDLFIVSALVRIDDAWSAQTGLPKCFQRPLIQIIPASVLTMY
jgi:hypothetical protein